MKTISENPESSGRSFAELMLQAKQVLPDAFDAQGRLLAPIAGKWMVPLAVVRCCLTYRPQRPDGDTGLE